MESHDDKNEKPVSPTLKSNLNRVGKSSLLIPSLSLGCSPLGELWHDVPATTALKAIETAYDLGIRHFDTAPFYGNGCSEARVGMGLNEVHRKKRELERKASCSSNSPCGPDFTVSTKVGRTLHPGNTSRSLKRLPHEGPWHGGYNLTIEANFSYHSVMQQHRESCLRMGLTKVDALVIHDLDCMFGGREAMERSLTQLLGKTPDSERELQTLEKKTETEMLLQKKTEAEMLLQKKTESQGEEKLQQKTETQAETLQQKTERVREPSTMKMSLDPATIRREFVHMLSENIVAHVERQENGKSTDVKRKKLPPKKLPPMIELAIKFECQKTTFTSRDVVSSKDSAVKSLLGCLPEKNRDCCSHIEKNRGCCWSSSSEKRKQNQKEGRVLEYKHKLLKLCQDEEIGFTKGFQLPKRIARAVMEELASKSTLQKGGSLSQERENLSQEREVVSENLSEKENAALNARESGNTAANTTNTAAETKNTAAKTTNTAPKTKKETEIEKRRKLGAAKYHLWCDMTGGEDVDPYKRRWPGEILSETSSGRLSSGHNQTLEKWADVNIGRAAAKDFSLFLKEEGKTERFSLFVNEEQQERERKTKDKTFSLFLKDESKRAKLMDERALALTKYQIWCDVAGLENIHTVETIENTSLGLKWAEIDIGGLFENRKPEAVSPHLVKRARKAEPRARAPRYNTSGILSDNIPERYDDDDIPERRGPHANLHVNNNFHNGKKSNWNWSAKDCFGSSSIASERVASERVTIEKKTEKKNPKTGFEGKTGIDALIELKQSGQIKAVGIGCNSFKHGSRDVCEKILNDAKGSGVIDFIHLAGPYNLLNQEALDNLIPLCCQKNVSIIIGAPFASDSYLLEAAPVETMEKVHKIQKICQKFSISLKAAALQFCSLHPQVCSVVSSVKNEDEVREAVRAMSEVIPEEFWENLKKDGLIREDSFIREDSHIMSLYEFAEGTTCMLVSGRYSGAALPQCKSESASTPYRGLLAFVNSCGLSFVNRICS